MAIEGDACSGSRVGELVDRLARLSQALQYSAGLNPAQWEALRYLAQANRYSCSPSALAEFLGITKGTASQTVIALEAKGLLRRDRSATDRRCVRVTVTEAGHAALLADPLAGIEGACAALPEGERLALANSLKRLLDILRVGKALPEFGPCGECRHLRPARTAGGGASCCGLTGEALCEREIDLLCMNFRGAG